jgi:hypothetical protein
MVTIIFSAVQQFLEWIAKKTNRTYHEVNIIAYYFLIPFTWAIMIDYIFGLPFIFSIAFSLLSITFALSCKNFTKFCDWLFNKSANFIEHFGDYYVLSVLLCVALPLIIYIVLGFFFINILTDN